MPANDQPQRIRVTGLWERTTPDGTRFLSGPISDRLNLVIFYNRFATAGGRDPEWIAYLSARVAAAKRPVERASRRAEREPGDEEPSAPNLPAGA